MKRPKCPTHPTEKLVESETRYGKRFQCPVPGCTVACWSGSTSTPADEETRRARMEAHDTLDKIWKSGMLPRKELYKLLAKHLGLPAKKTHIGHFTLDQCRQVIHFCRVVKL